MDLALQLFVIAARSHRAFNDSILPEGRPAVALGDAGTSVVSARAGTAVFMPLRQQPVMLRQASLPASVIRRQQMTDSTQSLS